MEKTAEIWKVFLTFFFFLGAGGGWSAWGNQSQMRNSTTPVTVSSESRTQRAAARTRRRSNPVSAATGAWTGKQRGNIIECKCVPVAATWLNDNNATRCVTIWFSVKMYRPRLDSGSDAFSCRALNVAFPTNIHQSVAWNVFGCFYWVVSWLQKFQKGAKLISHREWEQILGGGCEGVGGVFHPTVVRF